ncbi:E3 ubiquitin-protein ligase MARCHF8 isoform X1 [Nematostella vectensis]|uniref:E3 ubiquitin-protein ligase MARCHF8 isoform X1 n=2 Tax=Nematostella vectensis TaxID=45351 RepID=UPI0020778A67|nr:E3 ubiquitin-protein ligase MARCHF8 isoform X1 [Nematostella vectensis]
MTRGWHRRRDKNCESPEEQQSLMSEEKDHDSCESTSDCDSCSEYDYDENELSMRTNSTGRPSSQAGSSSVTSPPYPSSESSPYRGSVGRVASPKQGSMGSESIENDSSTCVVTVELEIPSPKQRSMNDSSIKQAVSYGSDIDNVCVDLQRLFATPSMASLPQEIENICELENTTQEARAEIPDELDGDACRICHCGGESEVLISPCLCMGTVRFVHHSCLMDWLQRCVKTKCELCLYPVAVRRKTKPLKKWRPPDEKPTPIIWLCTFIIALTLNIASIAKDGSQRCVSNPCIIFYVVGALGAMLGFAFFYHWLKKSILYIQKWLALNEEWNLIGPTNLRKLGNANLAVSLEKSPKNRLRKVTEQERERVEEKSAGSKAISVDKTNEASEGSVIEVIPRVQHSSGRVLQDSV